MTDQRGISSALAAFLGGRGPDSAGRYLHNVLEFSDTELESAHDYIQWLFPLPEPSSAVPGSPILTKAEIDAIRNDPDAQNNIRRAADRMTTFYEVTSAWLVPHDHNHLRITRIIRSMRILLDPEEAEEFLDAIMLMVARAGRPVSQISIKYWYDAAGARRSSVARSNRRP